MAAATSRHAATLRGLCVTTAGLAPLFNGGYGQVAWALPGKTHRYNRQAGACSCTYPTTFNALSLRAQIAF